MRARSLAAAVAVATLAGGAISGCGTGARQAANNAAAQADAARLADGQRMPAGAVRLGSEPGRSFEGGVRGRTVEVRWRVPREPPSQVYAFIDDHPPAGLNAPYTPGRAAVPDDLEAMSFGLTDLRGRVDGRAVMVEASRVRGGTTVKVLAETFPVQVRSPALRLPAGIRRIRLQVRTASGTSLESVTLTSPARVAAAVRYYNRLEAIQALGFSCPAALLDTNTITVDFLSGADDTVATATFRDSFHGASDACAPVALMIHHVSVGGLGGGNYVRSLARIFGVRLP